MTHTPHLPANLSENRQAIEVALVTKLLAKSINYDEIEQLMEALKASKVGDLGVYDHSV